ncbi:MAG: methylamine utilization protein [Betaproteobacteria bacterium]
MIRRFAVPLTIAAALALGLPLARLGAVSGTIEGTVKTAGGGPAADAVVFIEHAAGAPSSPGAATIDQRNMKFAPHVLPILAGTTVKFLNDDAVQHNVFSPDHEKYNLGTWPQGQTKEHVFAKCAKAPCAYVQLCRIHPEMEGFIVVLDNPYFAVTNAQGAYKIDNVPPGAYTLGVWAEKGKTAPKPVKIDGSRPATLDFAIGR